MAQQLPLPYPLLSENFSLGNYLTNEDNQALLQWLRHRHQQNSPWQLYLYGASGSGKSHLLQALVKDKGDHFYRLEELLDRGQWPLSGRRIALDNISLLATRPQQQLLLLRLLDKQRQQGHSLFLADRLPPQHVPGLLPDLRSRLCWGEQIAVPTPNDGLIEAILNARAKRLGIGLQPQLLHYMLRHYRRDVKHLVRCLERLEKASLMRKKGFSIALLQELSSSL